MNPLASARIIAVGSELLTPFRSDSNSLFLTARVNDCGIVVRGKSIVGDDVGPLTIAIRQALAAADLLVLTGGLGPTDDDITREAVSASLDRELTLDATVLEAIEARFARRKMPMPAINRRQAFVPRGAAVLNNVNGTAPGLWIDHGDGQVVVLLPGPPRELQTMFDVEVRPRLMARTSGRRLGRRVIRTTGWPESAVDERASPIYSPWRTRSTPIETTILAAAGQIELHLSAAGTDVAAMDRDLDEAASALATALGDIVISRDGRTLEQVIGDGLLARGWHVAAAESCTAGLLMGRLTEVPGSSAWLTGGVVAYDNTVKIDLLGVTDELIAQHGAVSEPVAAAMADGVRARLGADIGVAITGIAGPGGGSPTKPVGTVFAAVTMAGRAAVVRAWEFIGDRHSIRLFAVQGALDMVRRAIDRG